MAPVTSLCTVTLVSHAYPAPSFTAIVPVGRSSGRYCTSSIHAASPPAPANRLSFVYTQVISQVPAGTSPLNLTQSCSPDCSIHPGNLTVPTPRCTSSVCVGAELIFHQNESSPGPMTCVEMLVTLK